MFDSLPSLSDMRALKPPRVISRCAYDPRSYANFPEWGMTVPALTDWGTTSYVFTMSRFKACITTARCRCSIFFTVMLLSFELFCTVSGFVREPLHWKRISITFYHMQCVEFWLESMPHTITRIYEDLFWLVPCYHKTLVLCNLYP